MARLNVREIKEAAKAKLGANPDGVRFAKLVEMVTHDNPETNANTIFTVISNLANSDAAQVVKPSRGLYKLAAAAPAVAAAEVAVAPPRAGDEPPRVLEANFYESFAAWLRADLDEATEAVALGGAAQRQKWGTPDVVGTYKPLPDQLYKFPTEIVCAEIKIDPTQSVVAFGQAVAYRLFAHKTYLVMPRTLGEDEFGRLEALSLIFGLGLVMFDVNADEPNYTIRARAQRFNPDVFYVNEFIQRLSQTDVELFRRLFQ